MMGTFLSECCNTFLKGSWHVPVTRQFMKTFVFYLKRLAKANRVVYHGRTNQPKVALTFDDGPDPTYTPRILKLLQQYNVQATFFAIGKHVQTHPQLVRQENQEGHVVGTHTWTHPH